MIIIVFVFEMNVMYIDYAYGCYKHVYGCNACILMVYMSAILRDYYMTFSILTLVSARDCHIKPDSEAGGLIWVEG